MANTKKHTKKIGNKTRKNKDISIIKKINEQFKSKINNSQVKTLSKEFEKRMIHHEKSIPSFFKKYTYYTEIKEKENYNKYYIVDGKKHICILDLEKIGKQHSFFLVGKVLISNNENFLVFSVDTKGDRYHDIYIKFFFNEKIEKILSNVDSDIVISPDDQILYYLEMNKSMRIDQVFQINLETRNKKCLFKENDVCFNLGLSVTDNRQHVLLLNYSWESSHTYEIKDEKCELLFKKEKDLNYGIHKYNDTWIILYKKNNVSKVISTKDFKKYITILSSKPNIEYINCIIKSNYLCCIYKENGLHYFQTSNLINSNKKKLKLDNTPVSFNVSNIENLDMCSSNLILNINSNLSPNYKINLNLDTNKYEVVKYDKIKGYNSNNYSEKLLIVKDKLCITCLYRKDKFKKNMKCLLNGYGAYGTDEEPYFDSKIISLLDRGFIYCTAHIRGGGYHGDSWYKQGKLLKKMNTFKDFIACTEYLLKNNYTSREKLAIWGRSAGGLLIGAVLNMKPELYKLAILGVPFVDLITTMSDSSIPLTTEEFNEWGNPKQKKYRDYMEKYDPILNIDLKKDYPNIFIYSNIEDSLVQYKEPLKYYQKIKEAEVFKQNKKSLDMLINLKYGHVQSSKRYESLNEYGVYYSIIIDKLS